MCPRPFDVRKIFGGASSTNHRRRAAPRSKGISSSPLTTLTRKQIAASLKRKFSRSDKVEPRRRRRRRRRRRSSSSSSSASSSNVTRRRRSAKKAYHARVPSLLKSVVQSFFNTSLFSRWREKKICFENPKYNIRRKKRIGNSPLEKKKKKDFANDFSSPIIKRKCLSSAQHKHISLFARTTNERRRRRARGAASF